MRFFLILFLFLTTNAYAQCVTLDISDLTENQRSLLLATSYELVFDSGQNIVPTVNGGEICVPGYIGNLSAVINKPNLIARYQADKAARDAANAQYEADVDELRQLRQVLATTYTNWSGLTNAQKIDTTRQILRFIYLTEKVGS